MSDNFDADFDTRMNQQNFAAKFWRFVRYLSKRNTECWGFFTAGLMIGGIFL